MLTITAAFMGMLGTERLDDVALHTASAQTTGTWIVFGSGSSPESALGSSRAHSHSDIVDHHHHLPVTHLH